jgi:hypothetical protein
MKVLSLVKPIFTAPFLRAEIESQKNHHHLGINLDLFGYKYRTPTWNPAGIWTGHCCPAPTENPGMEVWLVSLMAKKCKPFLQTCPALLPSLIGLRMVKY